MRGRWFVGAYAAVTHLEPWNDEEQISFWKEIAAFSSVRGLELPLFPQGIERIWQALPRHWDFILTPLPDLMQTLAADPVFGLASCDPRGFRAALARAEVARQAVMAVNDHCGRAAVKAVHLHSAPASGRGDPRQLARALEELAALDWGGAELLVEHCDAYRPPLVASKGFLRIGEELDVLEKVGMGMTINWGRSALDERSAEGALRHIDQVLARGRLRALIFSGVAVGDSLYGDWQDNHAPLALGSHELWEPLGGLLTPGEIARVAARLRPSPPSYLGLKVQFFPSSLSRLERLRALGQQLEALEAIWSAARAGEPTA